MISKNYVNLLSSCGVPNRKIDEATKLLGEVDLSEYTKQNSIYFSGRAGVGKTVTAILLMLDFLVKSKRTDQLISKLDVTSPQYDSTYLRHLEARFIEIPSLLMQIRETYNRSISSKSIETEKQIVDLYSTVNFLVLDDLGIVKTTDWSISILYLIINNRYNNYKQTIITSNRSLDYLTEKLDDDRIPSRTRAMCKLIELRGEDKRSII
jgi:DNA replication protein DnaC